MRDLRAFRVRLAVLCGRRRSGYRSWTWSGPAEEAGLKAGDVIVAIDGRPTSTWLLPDARLRLKTAEGTRVRVSIKGGKREIELKLRDLV